MKRSDELDLIKRCSDMLGKVEVLLPLVEQKAKVDALKYIAAVCASLRPDKNAAYLGALRDVEVSIQAAIERTLRGERMESVTDLMGDD